MIEIETKENMSKIIKESQYFNRMTKYDLLARNIGTIDSYKKLYLDSIQEFTNNEKRILEEYTRKIDEIFTKFKFKNLLELPWKFCKIKSDIEQGWPHTLADIIILNKEVLNSPDLLTTLVHEKIHVYQRFFPMQTHILITDFWGFEILDTLQNIPKIRNNPDINNFVYGFKNKAFLRVYNSENPSSLNDTNLNNSLTEHPYELMAYLIPTVLKNSQTNFYISALISWMRQPGNL
jgi:hypothetical protein